ncbi:amidohydrolase [Specibacter cremeus]|uniref:amidohydrolase n=1 Tax=Specibacter cremeus TaxID=1629051 RepID=UPI000F79D6BE|nr:amidohydrolase [Specibacter cremeus]
MNDEDRWITGLGTGPDVLVRAGRVTGLGRCPVDAPHIVDAAGGLALPALVDAHVHPDKTLFGQRWHSRPPADTLRELIDSEVAGRGRIEGSVFARSLRLFTALAASGARAVRAHVDVGPGSGLDGVHGVSAAAKRLEGILDVQLVAFPQQGVLSAPGTVALLEAALAEGATVLGGIDPVGIDGDLHGQLDVLFAIARRHGVPLDIHLHDDGAQGREEMTAIAARTMAEGMAGLVTLSHAFALGDCPPAQAQPVADVLAAADIAVTTCALGAHPLVPVDLLRRSGVRVGLGSDGVRDAWTPFGTADMVDRVHLLAYRSDARTDAELSDCWDVGAHGGAAVLGLPRAGLQLGDRADLVLVPGENTAQIVVDRPWPRTVLRGGVPIDLAERLQAVGA